MYYFREMRSATKECPIGECFVIDLDNKDEIDWVTYRVSYSDAVVESHNIELTRIKL